MVLSNNCLAEKHISNTIEKFFSCTHIPIKAFKWDGTIIHSIGYDTRLNKVFDHNDIYERIENEIIKKDESSIVTIDCLDKVNFTACYICPRTVERGIYILGPYSIEKTNNMEFLYKPSSCVPHLISLLRMIGKDSLYIRQSMSSQNSPYSFHVKRAIDYIEARYSEQITLTDICNYLKINKCYFCTIFKKETKKTFTQVLNEIRIEKSKELLLKKNISILEVALSVGFNNQNYYNMTFKKLTNKTPLEFRNQNH
ncbi:AraC family transcriptional regulator [Tissierella sp. MSJ-40]|uniref:AraC family transcriptional regulator n=1 Tax=Tissierella simiarum TaxID=2841534 RepID=A0ABS6E2K4_9FIRM|nr:AraC family transcriptional regulator [Tissierella simiarum]MBU5437129.1 AraC family transcriptional regulator [Tissierella simiarum]